MKPFRYIYAPADTALQPTSTHHRLSNTTQPRCEVTLTVKAADGSESQYPLIVRIDTPVEIDYYRAGGILPYLLAQILEANA